MSALAPMENRLPVGPGRLAAVAIAAFLLGSVTGHVLPLGSPVTPETTSGLLGVTAPGPVTLQPGEQITIIAALPSPSPSPTPVPSPSPALTPTPVPTPAPTPMPTPRPSPSLTPVPTPTPMLARPFPAPVTTRTITVANGADVVAAVKAAPNGSIISLATNGSYALAGPISLNSKSNIVLLGNGATLHSAAGYTEASSAIQAFGASDIAIRNLKIVGKSPTPGIYIGGQEGAHGIRLVMGTRIEIDSVDISAVYGDAVNTDYWTDGVWMHDSKVHDNGRVGFAVLSGRNILIERNAYDHNGGMVLDIEPYEADGGADTVTFRNNTSTRQARGAGGPFDLGFYVGANGGGAGLKNITITGNTTEILTMQFVVPGTGLRYQNIVVTNNVGTVAAPGPVMHFAHIDGLTITGNVQPITSGTLASILDSTNVTGP